MHKNVPKRWTEMMETQMIANTDYSLNSKITRQIGKIIHAHVSDMECYVPK